MRPSARPPRRAAARSGRRRRPAAPHRTLPACRRSAAGSRSGGQRPLPGFARNRSWIVITSDSIRRTSVTCVTTPGAVDEPRDLDDDVERARDLLADRPQRQIDARREDEHLEARERVAGRVRVDGGERALVARVHRLEHVDRLRAANLADDDAVGPHAQGVPHEVADANLALPLDVGRPRLERDDVLLVELQLGCVLDREDPLAVRDEARQHVQQRRLADARAARDQDVELARARSPRARRRARASACPGRRDRSAVSASAENLRMVRIGPLQRERRHDHVHARAVGQAGIDHRRGLVDAAADSRRRSAR